METRFQAWKNKAGKLWPFLVIGAVASLLWSTTSGKIATVAFLIILIITAYLTLR